MFQRASQPSAPAFSPRFVQSQQIEHCRFDIVDDTGATVAAVRVATASTGDGLAVSIWHDTPMPMIQQPPAVWRLLLAAERTLAEHVGDVMRSAGFTPAKVERYRTIWN